MGVIRYLGVEQNTDLLDRNTELKWLKNEERARNWLQAWDTPYAYPEPDVAKNWNRRVRHVIVLPAKWVARQEKIQDVLYQRRGSIYQGFENDAVVHLAYGDKIEVLYKETNA